jgi:hypothetical protein
MLGIYRDFTFSEISITVLQICIEESVGLHVTTLLSTNDLVVFLHIFPANGHVLL